MGTSTDCDVLPFAAQYLLYSDWGRLEHNSFEQHCLACPEGALDGDLDELSDAEPILLNLEVRGWRYVKGIFRIGKHKNLYGDKWVKDDYIVYTINESDVSAAGIVELSACSYNRESLEVFLEDMKEIIEDVDIKETVALKHTC